MTIVCQSLLVLLISQAAPASTLGGIVINRDGKPIQGASIFISTAAPQKGVGVLCPSCYPDCRKSVVSDANGKFTFQELDPTLKFRLLTVAHGFAPAFTPKHIAPGSSITGIKLTPHDLETRDAKRVVRGRVINENGDPVARAVVSPQSLGRGSVGQQFGRLDHLGIDPLAVTDDNGEFRLGVGQDGDALSCLVRAPYLAMVSTILLTAGSAVHTIKLGPGATVTGRVVRNGRPLPNVELGMVQSNRGAGFLGHFEFATDRDGRFAFVNMATHEGWFIYGLMDSLKEYGSIPARGLITQSHGQTIELGDLEVQPAFRVSGRVILSDGKSVPADTQIMISCRDAWDSQRVIVAADGRFAFAGIAGGQMSVHVNVPGYHTSPRNRSFDLLNQLGLLGTITADMNDLNYLLDPGPRPDIDYQSFSSFDHAEHKRRQSSPLKGAASF